MTSSVGSSNVNESQDQVSLWPTPLPIPIDPIPVPRPIGPIEIIEVDAALGDRVWIDANGNGIQDEGNGPLAPGEVGLNGVKIKLLSTTGELVAETVTTNGPADAPGYYVFEDIDFRLPVGPNIRVAPPRYTIEFEAPDGYSFTKPDADPNQYLVGESPIDSDVDPRTGQVETGPLSPFGLPGAKIFTFDAGLVPDQNPPNKDGIVGDRVWFDRNRNGLQDEMEEGVNGITVKLFSRDGVFLAETITAPNTAGEAGFYRFEGLEGDRIDGDGPFGGLFEPGPSYIVEFELPKNYIFTLPNADPRLAFETDSGIDSDVDPATGRLTTFPLTNFIGGISPVQLFWDAGLLKVDRTITGTDQSEKLFGSPEADYILGNSGADRIFGGKDDDFIAGGDGDNRLFGQAGNDILMGGDGNERLKGTPTNSLDPNEVDTLNGKGGNDVYILGNAKGAFYDNGGDQDKALIIDFVSGQDKLQLFGSIGDYTVKSDELSSNIFRGAELIATVNRTFFANPIDLAVDARFRG